MGPETTSPFTRTGPSEGTALGNLLVQARACGALSGDRTALREVAIASSDLTTYHPGVLPLSPEQWDAAQQRAANGKA